MVLPEHVGLQVSVHNGHKFVPLRITQQMAGHKFGEFAQTRKKPLHKLHLKKIIDFLNLYKFVVFYHSHKINNPERSYVSLSKADQGRNVLFLVKCARLRKLTSLSPNQESSLNEKPLSKDLGQLRAKHSDNLPQSDKSSIYYARVDSEEKQARIIHLLRLVTKGGAMGSTRLVGCDSLEGMQNSIARANSLSSSNYVCLGGIYNNLYIDSADCLRLSRLSTESVHINLNNTLNQKPRLLQERLLWPLFMLNLSIKASEEKKK